MKTVNGRQRTVGSFERRMMDAEIRHLRFAIEVVLREPFGVPSCAQTRLLRIEYWQQRLTAMLNGPHLLHRQFCAVDAMLQRLVIARDEIDLAQRGIRHNNKPWPSSLQQTSASNRLRPLEDPA